MYKAGRAVLPEKNVGSLKLCVIDLTSPFLGRYNYPVHPKNTKKN